ncbi:hypothetical protein, partial [Brucella sp. LJL56]
TSTELSSRQCRQPTKSNVTAKPNQPTQRTNQPAASSVAALVVAPYRPHHSKLSTIIPYFFQKFFPQANKQKEPL